MAICIICGKKKSAPLCSDCRSNVDIEKLCIELSTYSPNKCDNKLWNGIASELTNPLNFRNIVFAITDELPTPRKEYLRIIRATGGGRFAAKDLRDWFYDTQEKIIDNESLSDYEKKLIKGALLNAYTADYRYNDADELADELSNFDDLPYQTSLNIADFYIKTRRYDEADDALNDALKKFSSNQDAAAEIGKMLEDSFNRRNFLTTRKKEYVPNGQEARELYQKFMSTLGIELDLNAQKDKIPKPIPKDEYPAPVEIRDTNFSSFVAFDVETTGLSTVTDSIIELSGIKVIDSVIDESEKFVFSELVKPFKKKVSEEIECLTGISQNDVKDKREMWEVIADFMKFVGDSVLVGYNCINFDSKFLARAGRYGNVIITNPYFDVMRYAVKFDNKLHTGDKISLEDISGILGIKNPSAHRALADALTTAKVFLKLKEMDTINEEPSLDDLLDDLDNW